VWFPVQDLLLSFSYRILPFFFVKGLLIFKECLILIVLFLLITEKMLSGKLQISYIELISIVYLWICVFYLFLSSSEYVPVLSVFTSFRSAILPIVFMVTGYWLNINKSELQFLLKIVFFMAVISVLFGIIEIGVSVDKFWNGIFDLHGYLKNIKGFQEGIAGGLVNNVPGNFWGNVSVRRMAGTFASPLALGYYLIVPIFFGITGMVKFKHRLFFTFVLSLGLLATETRAAIIVLAIAFFMYYFDLRSFLNLKFKKMFFVIIVLSAILFIAAFLCIYGFSDFISNTFLLKEGRSIGHANMLRTSLQNVKNTIFFGEGFGSAGGWASHQGSKVVGAGENAYFIIMYQIGGVGLALFLLWWVSVFYTLNSKSKSFLEEYWLSDVCRVLKCLGIAYFFTGFISEQILTFSSVAHFWVLTGALLGMDLGAKKILCEQY
jgi:hypothetical protein